MKKDRLERARQRVQQAEGRVLDQYRRIRERDAAGVASQWDWAVLDVFERRLKTLRINLAVYRLIDPPGGIHPRRSISSTVSRALRI